MGAQRITIAVVAGITNAIIGKATIGIPKPIVPLTRPPANTANIIIKIIVGSLYILKLLDIKLIYVPMGRITKPNSDDLARDLDHWGCIENDYLKSWVVKKMKERKYENFIN